MANPQETEFRVEEHVQERWSFDKDGVKAEVSLCKEGNCQVNMSAEMARWLMTQAGFVKHDD